MLETWCDIWTMRWAWVRDMFRELIKGIEMNYKRTHSNSTTAFPHTCDYACSVECGKPHGHGKYLWSIIVILALIAYGVIVWGTK